MGEDIKVAVASRWEPTRIRRTWTAAVLLAFSEGKSAGYLP